MVRSILIYTSQVSVQTWLGEAKVPGGVDINRDLVARLKLQQYTNAEIAIELGIVERTVERKLEHIRAIWSSEAPD